MEEKQEIPIGLIDRKKKWEGITSELHQAANEMYCAFLEEGCLISGVCLFKQRIKQEQAHFAVDRPSLSVSLTCHRRGLIHNYTLHIVMAGLVTKVWGPDLPRLMRIFRCLLGQSFLGEI